VPQFSLFIAGAICATASIVMAFVAMGLFLVAKVSLALLLAVGPGLHLLRDVSRHPALCGELAVQRAGRRLHQCPHHGGHHVSRKPAANACLHVLSAYSAASILADVVGLLFLSITAAYVLLHVASLGASLAGGLSLGNPGGDATRSGMLLLHSVTSGLSRLVPLALASTGGSSEWATNRGGPRPAECPSHREAPARERPLSTGLNGAVTQQRLAKGVSMSRMKRTVIAMSVV
jgi:type IV secretion system protein VirB6